MMGATRSIDDAIPAEATPFSSSSPVTLTLEQYASMTAETMVRPADLDGIRRQYGLPSQQDVERVERDFRKRFSRDPAEHRRDLALVSDYRAWLESQRGR
jgi:hypothetical protein